MLLPNTFNKNLFKNSVPKDLENSSNRIHVSVGSDLDVEGLSANVTKGKISFSSSIEYDNFGPGYTVKGTNIKIIERSNDSIWLIDNPDNVIGGISVDGFTATASTIAGLSINKDKFDILDIYLYDGDETGVITLNYDADEYHFVRLSSPTPFSYTIHDLVSNNYLVMDNIFIKERATFNKGVNATGCKFEGDRTDNTTGITSTAEVFNATKCEFKQYPTALTIQSDANLINCTFVESDNAIDSTGFSSLVNSIIQSDTSFLNSPTITTCTGNIFKDAGYTGNDNNIILHFNSAGLTPVHSDLYIGKGWTEYKKEEKMSIGNLSATGTLDLAEDGSISITNADFVVGDRITIDGSDYILHSFIDSKWFITGVNGDLGAISGLTGVDYSCTRFHSDFSTVFDLALPSGSSRLINTTIDIPDVDGLVPVDTPMQSNMRVTLQAAEGFRFDGEFDSSKVMSGNITIDTDNVSIRYLQFEDKKLDVSNGKNVEVSNNFFNKSNLLIDKYLYNEYSIIFDDLNNKVHHNIFYNVEGAAIEVDHNPAVTKEIIVSSPTTAAVYIELYDAGYNLTNYKVKFSRISGAKDVIVWGAGYVEIATVSSSFNTSNYIEKGVKWGDLTVNTTYHTNLPSPGVYSPSVINDYVDRTTDTRVFIYNNTIIKAEYGIYIEYMNNGIPTSVADVYNNIVSDCKLATIFPSFTSSEGVDSYGNVLDDMVVGDNLISTVIGTVKYRNKSIGDFSLTPIDKFLFGKNGSKKGAIPFKAIEGDCRSVGLTGSLKGNIDAIVIKDDIAKFLNVTGDPVILPVDVGPGDKITLSNSDAIYIREGIDSYNCLIGNYADGTYTITEIERAFNNIPNSYSGDTLNLFVYHDQIDPDFTFASTNTVIVNGNNANINGTTTLGSDNVTLNEFKANTNISSANNNVTISNCNMQGTSGIAIELTGSNCKIYNNLISGYATGIDAGASTIVGNTVVNCTAIGVKGDDIYNTISTSGFDGATHNCVEIAEYDSEYRPYRFKSHTTLNNGYSFNTIDSNSFRLGKDKDGVEYSINNSIGCYGKYINPEIIRISVSSNTSNVSKASFVTVLDNVMAFTEEQDNRYLTAGDIVTYDTSKMCVLKRKRSLTEWVVAGFDGESVEDAPDIVRLNSITHAFSDINSALASFSNTFGSNLTNSLIRLYVLIGDSSISGGDAVLDTTLTTNTSYNVNIKPALNTDRICNSIQGHKGIKNNPNRYLLDSLTISNINNLYIAGVYVVDGDVVVTGDDITMDGFIISNGSVSKTGNNITVVNSVVDKSNGTDPCYSVDNVVNCVAITTSGQAGYWDQAYVANSIHVGSGAGFLGDNNFNCITSDNTLELVNNNHRNTSVVFRDNNKYYTKSSPSFYGEQAGGTANVLDITKYALHDITLCRKRMDRFDVGAFRYIPEKTYYTSVADSTSTLIDTTIDFTIYSGEVSIITFERRLGVDIVSGDKITSIGNNAYVLGERICDSSWLVTNPDGTMVTAGEIVNTAVSIKHGSSNEAIKSGSINLNEHRVYTFIGGIISDAQLASNPNAYNNSIWIVTPTHRLMFGNSPLNIDKAEFPSIDITINNDYSSIIGVRANGSIKVVANNNIISDCYIVGGGIYVESVSGKNLIINNRLVDCYNAIKTDISSSETIIDISKGDVPATCIANNTLLNGDYGAVETHSTTTLGSQYITYINNIIQDFSKRCLISNGVTGFVSNITSDQETITGAVYNVSNNSATFKPGESLYLQNAKVTLDMVERVENKAVNSSVRILNRDCFPLHVDAIGVLRPQWNWDKGAMTRSSIYGYGDMNSDYPAIGNMLGFAGVIEKPFELYLRKPLGTGIDPDHVLLDVDLDYQFPSIQKLNDWVNDGSNSINISMNLVIYVEGGIEFGGVFQLSDRGTRSVLITTLSNESSSVGPGRVKYTGNLMGDESKQGSVTLKGISVIPDSDTGTLFYLDTYTASINNSIILVPTNTMCGNPVTVTSSNIIFKNTPTIKFSNNTSKVFNSMVLTNYSGSVSIDFSDVSYEASNNLAYNYDGDIVYNQTSINSISNTDPDFKYFILPSSNYDNELVLMNGMALNKGSVAIDNGSNSYTSSSIDVYGRSRVFNGGTIDIGASEEEYYNMYIEMNNIFSIESIKLFSDHERDSLRTPDLDKEYKDAYLKLDNSEEFVRESNVIVELKELGSTYVSVDDKSDELYVVVNAVLDNRTSTIIFQKDDKYNADYLASIFKDGRYKMYLDEINGILKVYISNIYGKGLSGPVNVVNSVKFSSSRVVRR